jgi:hypothetical protein
MGEWMYRSTFSWPRHQLEVSGQLHAPATLSLGKKLQVPIRQDAGWAPDVDGVVKRKSWPYRDSNSDPSFVKPVASPYTDYAIRDEYVKFGKGLMNIS